ncbi:MAG: polysaccharide deacetylase family protein [Pseudomonadota bacterium]
MLRRLALALLVACLAGPFPAAAQRIAFSFDDGLDPRVQPQAARWNRAILDALSASRVRALLLPAGKNVDSPAGLALVRDWGAAGHAIGNHTYAHRNLGSQRMSADAFVADVARADVLLRGMPGWIPVFRYPYLKEGDEAGKRDAVRGWLRTHRYGLAPVSIDTSDWYYASRFAAWRAAHPGGDVSPWRQAYLDHLWDRANYYDALGVRTVGRSVPHVILLHTNAINAAFLADAIAMFRDRGWTVVDPEVALADPVYAAVDTLPAGESVLWARARAAGDTSLRYPAEDAPHEQARLDAIELPPR